MREWQVRLVCSLHVPHHPVIVDDNVARTGSSGRRRILSVELTRRVWRPVVDRVTDVVCSSSSSSSCSNTQWKFDVNRKNEIRRVHRPVSNDSGDDVIGRGRGEEMTVIKSDGSHRRRAVRRGSYSPHQWLPPPLPLRCWSVFSQPRHAIPTLQFAYQRICSNSISVGRETFCCTKIILSDNRLSKSVFSLVPRLSTWRYPQLLPSAGACSKYLSIAGTRRPQMSAPALSSKLAAAAAHRRDRQTNGQTDGHPTVT